MVLVHTCFMIPVLQFTVIGNQNIFADSLILESTWNNHDVDQCTNTYNNGSSPVNQDSFNNNFTHRKRGGGVQPRDFGFIPHAIPLFSSQKATNQIPFAPTKEWLQEINTKVKDYKVPNYRGVRIRVPSGLHIQAWRALAIDYDFKIFTEYIEFGFPMNVTHENSSVMLI